MHDVVFAAFDQMCRRRGAGGRVLEIGAVPGHATLLRLPALANATSRIGLSLDEPFRDGDLQILQGNAHEMSAFSDASFDTVLCNAVLEHDPLFWLTLSEMRRVARAGALIAIGVPGYTHTRFPLTRPLRRLRTLPIVGRRIRGRFEWLEASAATLGIHNFPGDYYRFSEQAMREVLLHDLRDIQVSEVMRPPRLIGSGFRP